MLVEKIEEYSIKNEQIILKITNAGAAITSLKVRDRHQNWVDIVLGFEDLTNHITNNGVCFGSVVGRNANRIKNGQFSLNNVEYQLEKNNGENNLHSGSNGFHLRFWEILEKEATKITLKLVSENLDQGFPGNLEVKVTYEIKDNQLTITYIGLSDQDTLFNPTNHSYFNLNGHQGDSVMTHHLKIPSDYYMPMALDSVPTGVRAEVVGTPMDFRAGKKIGADFDLRDEQLKRGNGYDHHFVLNRSEEPIVLSSEESGISMTTTTEMPGVQVYTANFVTDIKGKEGVLYHERSAVCLETQFCPDAINNEEVAPILKKNTQQSYKTTWAFSCQ